MDFDGELERFRPELKQIKARQIRGELKWENCLKAAYDLFAQSALSDGASIQSLDEEIVELTYAAGRKYDWVPAWNTRSYSELRLADSYVLGLHWKKVSVSKAIPVNELTDKFGGEAVHPGVRPWFRAFRVVRACVLEWESKAELRQRELTANLQAAPGIELPTGDGPAANRAAKMDAVAGEAPDDGPEARARVRRSVVEPILVKNGWSEEQWSREVGVDIHTVQNYLNGRANPQRKTRKAMADALGIGPEKLPK
jgi:ribosome-binding protein aMBF1 (putative translation factor)